MYDAADDPAIVRPLDTSHICRQARFDPLPLLIAEPKQIPAHGPIPKKRITPYGIRIVLAWQQN
jgi:uncharacterized protein